MTINLTAETLNSMFFFVVLTVINRVAYFFQNDKKID